jgi:NAD kinase
VCEFVAYREAVDAIASGRISYSKRSLLSVELRTNKRALSSVHALNDAVVSRGDLSRLIKLTQSERRSADGI